MKQEWKSGGVAIIEAPTEQKEREPTTELPTDEELVELLERAFRYVGPPLARRGEQRTPRRMHQRLGRRMAYRLLTGRAPGRRPPRPFHAL